MEIIIVSCSTCNVLNCDMLFTILTGGSGTILNGGGIQAISNVITNIYFHGIVVGNALLTDDMRLNPFIILNNR